MSETKHTPGPWEWDGEFPIVIYSADGYVICSGLMPSGEANAHLIEAAPDLLQAAEQFLASVKDGNVSELVEYYADIFGDAVKKAVEHLPE